MRAGRPSGIEAVAKLEGWGERRHSRQPVVKSAQPSFGCVVSRLVRHKNLSVTKSRSYLQPCGCYLKMFPSALLIAFCRLLIELVLHGTRRCCAHVDANRRRSSRTGDRCRQSDAPLLLGVTVQVPSGCCDNASDSWTFPFKSIALPFNCTEPAAFSMTSGDSNSRSLVRAEPFAIASVAPSCEKCSSFDDPADCGCASERMEVAMTTVRTRHQVLDDAVFDVYTGSAYGCSSTIFEKSVPLPVRSTRPDSRPVIVPGLPANACRGGDVDIRQRRSQTQGKGIGERNRERSLGLSTEEPELHRVDRDALAGELEPCPSSAPAPAFPSSPGRRRG